MRYLNSFKIFESVEPSKVVALEEEVDYLLANITDDGFDISIKKLEISKYESGYEKIIGYFIISFENPIGYTDDKLFKIDEIYDELDRMVKFLSDRFYIRFQIGGYNERLEDDIKKYKWSDSDSLLKIEDMIKFKNYDIKYLRVSISEIDPRVRKLYPTNEASSQEIASNFRSEMNDMLANLSDEGFYVSVSYMGNNNGIVTIRRYKENETFNFDDIKGEIIGMCGYLEDRYDILMSYTSAIKGFSTGGSSRTVTVEDLKNYKSPSEEQKNRGSVITSAPLHHKLLYLRMNIYSKV